MLPVEDQTWAMDLFFFAIAKDLYNYYAFYGCISADAEVRFSRTISSLVISLVHVKLQFFFSSCCLLT